MREKMMVGTHRYTTKEYAEGWDRIFGKGEGTMCYGMCKYERKIGPDVGECTVGSKKPHDAACMNHEDSFNCDECDNGAFTECDGHCMEVMNG